MPKKLADLIIGAYLLHNRSKETEELNLKAEARQVQRLNEIQFRAEQKIRVIEAQRRLEEERRLNEMNPNMNVRIN